MYRLSLVLKKMYKTLKDSKIHLWKLRKPLAISDLIITENDEVVIVQVFLVIVVFIPGPCLSTLLKICIFVLNVFLHILLCTWDITVGGTISCLTTTIALKILRSLRTSKLHFRYGRNLKYWKMRGIGSPAFLKHHLYGNAPKPTNYVR